MVERSDGVREYCAALRQKQSSTLWYPETTAKVPEGGMRKTLLVTSMMVVAVALAGSAWAGSPTEELRRHTDRLLEILRAPGLSPQMRREATRELALEVFDVAETAKRVLGPHWQRRTPAEREAFVQLFTELLDRTYISYVDRYGGETVRYVGERVEGDSATVVAMIVTKSG